MCEYRLFYPLNDDIDNEVTSFDLFEGDTTKATISRSCFSSAREEKRTDVYYAVGASIGIKYRGGRRLEIKLRTSGKSGEIECWKKKRLRSSPDDDEAILKELASFSRFDDMGKERIDSTRRGKFCRVSVAKRRIRCYLPKLFDDSVVCEQTDFEVRILSEGFPGSEQVGTGRRWRTICIEGRADAVAKASKLLQNKIPTSQRRWVMGYPEFVSALVFQRKDFVRYFSTPSISRETAPLDTTISTGFETP